MSVYIFVTLDTKGTEAALLRDCLIFAGVETVLVDTGVIGQPQIAPNIAKEEVFLAAGTTLGEIQSHRDRGEAVTAAASGAAEIARSHFAAGKLTGVIGLGGSAGTTIGTAAMRALPLGVPKLMVSTLASGQVRHYVGDKDILMLNSVVDILGVNRVSRPILINAAAAMAGMITLRQSTTEVYDKPVVAATMFGVTTQCVERAQEVLAGAGFEVIVFHATGSGGRAMETLIEDGIFSGVLDITTTEIADEIVGGFLSAGSDRLTAAGRLGIPQVVSVGATDMVNFHALDTVPEKFRDRTLYKHNDNVTLMRTSEAECAAIGQDIGNKLAASLGPVAVLLPRGGVSAIDRKDQPFDDPAAREALFVSLRNSAGPIEISESEHHINDPEFAEAMARRLIELMRDK